MLREAHLADIEDGIVLKVHTLTYQKIADALDVTLGQLDGSEDLAKDAKLEDELSPNQAWLVRSIVRLILILGTLTLIGLFLSTTSLLLSTLG